MFSNTIVKIAIAVVSVGMVAGVAFFFVSGTNNNIPGKTVEGGGCCLPFCELTDQNACEDVHGGEWHDSGCEKFEECQEGCCTPQCVEGKKVECEMFGGEYHKSFCSDVSECNLGCCSPFGKMTTETVCTQSGGETWNEGEQCKGMSANLFDDGDYPNYSGYGHSGHHDFFFNAYTCGDSYKSEWTADFSFVWTVSFGGGSVVDKQEETITFTPDANNNFTFTVVDSEATGEVTEDYMRVNVTLPWILENITMESPIVKGGQQCGTVSKQI